MHRYRAPLRDLRFILENVLDAPKVWAELPAFRDVDMETVHQVLEAGSRFAAEVLAPINAEGDRVGCTRDAEGNVKVPAAYRAAYDAFVAGGWPSLGVDAAVGGQGLPQPLDAALHEMLVATNHGWTMYPGLLHGAVEVLRAHGSNDLQTRYLPKLVAGEWLVAMALSEPQAGSDLGLVQTRAAQQVDGTLHVDGSKIFVSGGDHDLTDNIIHLVLCRLDGAKPGTKGLSLVLVPKWLPDGRRNGIVCDGIERKLGIHGSATCVMRYERACGWLIGEAGRGLAAMFLMMNSARLRTGLQGVAHADAALQRAHDYAVGRLQGRAPGRSPDAGRSADPIICHAAVRRKLLGLQAFVEGGRTVAGFTALRLDVARHHPNPEHRGAADADVSLLTPVLKAFLTHEGFRRVSDGLQILGGSGYLEDSGLEQILRDARIPMIYEGTNEIQAVDLLVRKVLGSEEGGRTFDRLVNFAHAEARAAEEHPLLQPFAVGLSSLCKAATVAMESLRGALQSDPERPYRIAEDHLMGTGHLLLAWAWTAGARAALGLEDRTFANHKFAVCLFGAEWMMDEGKLHWERVARAPALASHEMV